MFAFVAAILFALTDPTPTPIDPATPSALTLDIPPGWHRTESGIFNEWQDAEHSGNFRVTPMGPDKRFQGPGATDAVKALFVEIAAAVHPNPNVTVTAVSVCNGTQKAYRVDDPLGIGSPGFMMIIPGSASTALINYEIRNGFKADPAILAMIDKLCWP